MYGLALSPMCRKGTLLCFINQRGHPRGHFCCDLSNIGGIIRFLWADIANAGFGAAFSSCINVIHFSFHSHL